MTGVYLVGDWCSGRLWGLGWDGSQWQFEELLQTDLQFTAGGYDDDGNVLAVNCECFYLSDVGPTENPPGSVWQVMAADEVPEGAETARTVQKTPDRLIILPSCLAPAAGQDSGNRGSEPVKQSDNLNALPVLLIAALLISLSGLALPSLGHAQGGNGEPAGMPGPEGGPVMFLDPIDNSPLDVPLPEGEELTEAVAQFHETGENLHDGDPAGITAGKALYAKWCQACHMPDGSGRIGPSLIDEQHNHARTGTDIGMFEIIWAGGLGAMQSFATRLTQDEILQIIAHINDLKPGEPPAGSGG
jgi:cytochrome c(L)